MPVVAHWKWIWFGIELQVLRAVVDQEMAALGTGNQSHANLAGNLQTHLGDAGA